MLGFVVIPGVFIWTAAFEPVSGIPFQQQGLKDTAWEAGAGLQCCVVLPGVGGGGGKCLVRHRGRRALSSCCSRLGRTPPSPH